MRSDLAILAEKLQKFRQCCIMQISTAEGDDNFSKAIDEASMLLEVAGCQMFHLREKKNIVQFCLKFVFEERLKKEMERYDG